ncbi:MAG: M56 family metallopeptidase, partial [Oscillospiraceae bacterium]|nr:M56 family metallopeptidase [Oscillospiraceae bacterium]
TNFPQAPAAPNVPTLPDAPEPPAAPDLTRAPIWLGWTWLAGSAAVALILLVSNLWFYWKLRRERVSLDEADCPLRVYTAVGLPSPCLFGVFRPAIYVTPEAAADPDMLRHVLAHEYTHYRQGDHLWSLLRCGALAAHWWNPLVWLAAVLSQRDAELACDEGALKRLGDGERAGYGNTLLNLVTAKPRPADLLRCATTMAGDKKSLKERISRIAKAPKRVIWAVVVAVLVTALACVCAFGQAAEPEGADEPEPDPTASLEPSSEPAARQGQNGADIPIWPYGVSEMVYVRDKGGFGTDFTIQLVHDGSFTYYEGVLSSYIGRGTWTRDGDMICLADKVGENLDNVGIKYYYFKVDGGDLVFQAENSAEFIHLDVVDGERFSRKASKTDGEQPVDPSGLTPDLNHNSVPETIIIRPTDDGGIGLEVWENNERIFSEAGYYAHAGWNAVFLCTLDGKDYLLRYYPNMGQGWCTYSYELFTLTRDGKEKVVRENSVEFDINFGLMHESFDPEAIAAFMDEINGLLANSVQLINTDEDLAPTFEKEGRLYDSLGWLDWDWGTFVRDSSKSLLENLRDFKEAMEGEWYAGDPEVTDIQEAGSDHLRLVGMRYQDRTVEFFANWDSYYQPSNEVKCQVLDLNSDGRDEIVCIFTDNHGTGVFLQEPHIFDAQTLEEYNLSGLRGGILEQIKSTGDEENFYLSAPGLRLNETISRQEVREGCREEIDIDPMADTLNLGDWIGYTIEDGQMFCWLGCDATGMALYYPGYVKIQLSFTGSGFQYGAARYTTDRPFQ